MGYAELIEKLHTLPEDKQAEVFDFVDFLANRNQVESQKETTLEQSSLAEMMKNPMKLTDFTPLSRDEANAR